MPKGYRPQHASDPEQSSASGSGHGNSFAPYQEDPLYPHSYPATYAVYPSGEGMYEHPIQGYTPLSPDALGTGSGHEDIIPWNPVGPGATTGYEQRLWTHPSAYDIPDPQYDEYQLGAVYPFNPSSDPPRSHPPPALRSLPLGSRNPRDEQRDEQQSSRAPFSVPPSPPSLSVTHSSPASDSSQHSSPALQQSALESTLASSSDTRAQKVPCPVKSIERRVKGAKIIKKSKGKKTTKRGKLTVAQKEKADDMRYYGACWRCKRYKKSCNGPGVCDTCLTSGFRVWPSALGCRRGNLECFAFGVLPPNAEHMLKDIDFTFQRPNSWRTAPRTVPSELYIAPAAATGDKWEQLSFKVQCTGIHGPGILELLEIGAQFQRTREKENRVVGLAMATLSNACDLYSICVATPNPLPFTALIDTISRTRTSLQQTLNFFLISCLSDPIKEWLPAFISACTMIFAYIVLTDALYAIPASIRNLIWFDISAIIMELRQHLYPMAQDLLSALAKASKPLKQTCWEIEEVVNERGERRMERTVEGMKLVDQDKVTYDSLRALQDWYRRYEAFVKDERWLASAPFTVDLLPITALSKIFDFSPRK